MLNVIDHQYHYVEVPDHLPLGNYSVRVEGNDYGSLRGSLFTRESSIAIFKPKLVISIKFQQPPYEIPQQ